MPSVRLDHLRFGNTDSCVGVLQTALKNKGYNPGPIDNVYGNQTKDAVQRFQRAQGWSGSGADGIPGSLTLQRLGLTQITGSDTPAPPPATPTGISADAIRAAAKGGSTVSSAYNEGNSSGPVVVYSKNGALYWTSGMSIDCDGQPGSKCSKSTDPYFQPNTAWNQSDGKPLKAEVLPYVVIPLASSRWDYTKSGVRGGDLCVMAYKNKYVFGVVGDLGPSQRIGEASYAAAEALGINPNPRSGGIGSGVTYIVFPGVRVSPIENKAEAVRVGTAKLSEWLGVTQPNPEPPTTPQPEQPISGTVIFEKVYVGAPVSEDVKIVQRALNKFRPPVTVDGDFGTKTKAAYSAWQKSLGYTGADADGNPGFTSMSRLASTYGFTLKRQSEVPAPNDGEPEHDYRRVSYTGKTINMRTKIMLDRAVDLLTEYDWTPRLTQGSYNRGGVSASAGTHDGGGVIDINVSTMTVNGMHICVQALRKAGFAAWLRTPAQGFDYHIHAVAIGDREMSSAAKSQIQQWREDRNGLANRGSDPYPDPYPSWTRKYR